MKSYVQVVQSQAKTIKDGENDCLCFLDATDEKKGNVLFVLSSKQAPKKDVEERCIRFFDPGLDLKALRDLFKPQTVKPHAL